MKSARRSIATNSRRRTAFATIASSPVAERSSGFFMPFRNIAWWSRISDNNEREENIFDRVGIARHRLARGSH